MCFLEGWTLFRKQVQMLKYIEQNWAKAVVFLWILKGLCEKGILWQQVQSRVSSLVWKGVSLAVCQCQFGCLSVSPCPCHCWTLRWLVAFCFAGGFSCCKSCGEAPPCSIPFVWAPLQMQPVVFGDTQQSFPNCEQLSSFLVFRSVNGLRKKWWSWETVTKNA